ncbi:MAG: helix-turn-helix domain-containing protein, partial [Cellulosilyticaceae bacterium]
MDSLNTIITIPNIGERLVSGEKLKKARLYREFSQEELATRLGVSKQAISKYESNKSQISSDIVARLPKALGFPIKFFIQDENVDENEKSIVYFRTKNIPKKTKEHLMTKIEILDKEIMGFYKRYIEFPQANVPDLTKYVVAGKCNYDREEIIEIVKIIREEWGLDHKPIVNLAYTLQSNGFVLNKQYINQDKTDGLS